MRIDLRSFELAKESDVDLTEVQRLTAALATRGVRALVYHQATPEMVGRMRQDAELDPAMRPEIRDPVVELQAYLMEPKIALPAFARLEGYDAVVMFGLRNPKPVFPGPMIWTALFPTEPGPIILHRVLTSALPVLGRMEEELPQSAFMYDGTRPPITGTVDDVVALVDGRLQSKYKVENLPPSYMFLMRVLFTIGEAQ